MLWTTFMLLSFVPAQLDMDGSPAASVVAAADADGAGPDVAVAGDDALFGVIPQNVGPIDRMLRIGVGTAFAGGGAALTAFGAVDGRVNPLLLMSIGGGMMAFSAIPLATGALGYCPIYTVFGIDKSF